VAGVGRLGMGRTTTLNWVCIENGHYFELGGETVQPVQTWTMAVKREMMIMIDVILGIIRSQQRNMSECRDECEELGSSLRRPHQRHVHRVRTAFRSRAFCHAASQQFETVCRPESRTLRSRTLRSRTLR